MTGNEMKDLRERAGLTLSEVADELGVHLQTVYRWEKGGEVRGVYAEAFRRLIEDDGKVAGMRQARRQRIRRAMQRPRVWREE